MLANPLKILFNKTISGLFGFFADLKLPGFILSFWIWIYVKYYKIDMSLYERDINNYKSFNDFFARRLKNPRDFNKDKLIIISPSDGIITQLGMIDKDLLIQSKKRYYRLEELIISRDFSSSYQGGAFLSIHLTPSDYHRFHCPIDARILRYAYIKGSLFPVNKFGRGNINNLYTRNERVVVFFENEKLNFALVAVGAFIVGRICFNHFDISYKESGIFKEPENIKGIEKGEEIGRFEMGSSIILLFPKNSVELRKGLAEGKKIKFGEVVAKVGL